MSKRILAVSPIPANLVLAACYREHWDSIRIVSRKLVIGELGRYAEIDGLSRVTFFLDGVENSAEARKKLQGLARKKVAIEWVSARSSEEIKSACRGIAGVEFRESTSQEEFLASVGAMKVSDRALFRALREPSGDLHDFLRYKLNLALMAGFDLKPLIEAIDQMVAFKEDGWFNVSRLPEADKVSLQQFRDCDFPYLEGHSPPIQELKDFLPLAGRADRSALILGNTGTGKEAAAFFLHEYSPRRGKPYVAINCAGFEKDLLLAELFGYKKGAFTGALQDRKGLVEEANGGTLFLDEVGEMAPSVQAALLRFLETKRFRPLGENREKGVDIRLVAAGQPSLRQKMERGEFRKDLFYRLAQVEMETPDLALIRQDIPDIIKQLLYKWFHSAEDTYAIHQHWNRVTEDFITNLEILNQYSWPGNVRELSTLVRRILDYKIPAFTQLAKRIREGKTLSSARETPLFANLQPGAFVPLDEVKRDYIHSIVKANSTLTKKEIATRLGIAFNTLNAALGGKDLRKRAV